MTKNKKGFTIIEVVLVLAIAGLIFLMVFIALPALQRSQRNTRRRSDMARILSTFTEYQSNNGKMPTNSDVNAFIQKYATAGAKDSSGNYQTNTSTTCVGDQFCDPDGTPYKLAIHGPFTKDSDYGEASTQAHEIFVFLGASCDPDTEGKAIYAKGGSNQIALLYVLEGGAIYCGDNQ